MQSTQTPDPRPPPGPEIPQPERKPETPPRGDPPPEAPPPREPPNVPGPNQPPPVIDDPKRPKSPDANPIDPRVFARRT